MCSRETRFPGERNTQVVGREGAREWEGVGRSTEETKWGEQEVEKDT